MKILKKGFCISIIFLTHNTMAIDFAFMSPSNQQIIEDDLEKLCSLDYSKLDENRRKTFKTMFGFELSCVGLRSFLEDNVDLIVKDWMEPGNVIAEFDENEVHMNLAKSYFNRARLMMLEEYKFTSINPYALSIFFKEMVDVLSKTLRPEYKGTEDKIRLFFIYDFEGERKKVPLLISNIISFPDRFFQEEENVNFVIRTSLIFHEAAHLAFNAPHLKGHYDRGMKSAYGLQGTLLTIFSELCDTCSEEEKKQAMRGAEFSFSRVIIK